MDLHYQNMIERLENIFMPYVAKRKKELKNSNNQFVHYTSAENAINIINSKEFWMRSPKCMNDYMEINHGHEQLIKFFDTPEHKEKFIEALDSYQVGIADEILKEFAKWWKQIQNDTFIASVSVHSKSEDQHGRLSMWRAYGEQPAKAAIVLNNPPENMTNLNLILSPAAYFTYEELEKELLSMINNINKNIEFIQNLEKAIVVATTIISLIILAVCLKHPGFKEEQEWRIIYLPTMPQFNNLIKSSVKSIGGVPQVIYKIPLNNYPEYEISGMSISDLVDKIIIGPTQFPIALFDAFNISLSDAGVKDAPNRIIISDIPLRT